MNLDSLLYVFCLTDTTALLFLAIYIVTTLSDLECDSLNGIECCSKLNQWIIPEIIGTAAIDLILLITGRWILFVIHVPFTIWLVSKFVNIPRGNLGVYEPTAIHSSKNLKCHIRDAVIRLVFQTASLFIFLFSLIIALLNMNKH